MLCFRLGSALQLRKAALRSRLIPTIVVHDGPTFRSSSTAVSAERCKQLVTTVVLNRPHVRNAVDGPTAAALAAAFVHFETDPSAHAAVLWGAGGNFCAGADLKAFSGGSNTANKLIPMERRLPQDRRLRAAARLRTDAPMGPTRMRLSKPVIAAVEGYAVAGGLELAVWADMRVAAEDAVFGIFCRRWGVPLIDGGTVRLPRLIGAGRAADLILTGRPVSAREAHAIGLVDRLVPPGTARQAAEALAQEITLHPQACVRSDRAAMLSHGHGYGHGYGSAAAGAESGDDNCDEEDDDDYVWEHAALAREFRLGMATLSSGESVKGATRFAAGAGRGGTATSG